MPNCGEIITALNVKLGINDSFERQTEDAALNAKWKRDMMVLNAKLKCKEIMRGKYVLVQRAATTLNPQEGSKRDSMSLEIYSVDESEWSN